MQSIGEEVLESIDRSVLCWLATVDAEGQPNVSPKEAFTVFEDKVLIANIASPKSVKNMINNAKVCVSFLDIFNQKGHQLYGLAQVLKEGSAQYDRYRKALLEITQGKYPFKSLTAIEITKAHPIIAPSYFLFPEESQVDKAANAFENYKRLYEK